MATKAKVYERQKKEPLLWYERFKNYYLPLEDNANVQKAWEAYINGEKMGKRGGRKSPNDAWYKAADKWDWEGRKLAFDREVYAGALRTLVKDVRSNVVDRVQMGLNLQRKIRMAINQHLLTEDVSLGELTMAFKRLNEATAPDFEKFVELYGEEVDVDQGVEKLDADALDHVIDSYAAMFDHKPMTAELKQSASAKLKQSAKAKGKTSKGRGKKPSRKGGR